MDMDEILGLFEEEQNAENASQQDSIDERIFSAAQLAELSEFLTPHRPGQWNMENRQTDDDTPPPIKMSLHSADGQIHVQYENQDQPHSNNTIVSNAEAASTTDSVKKTMHEIDLYCSSCDHFYMSLNSYNRHLQTRKHADKLIMHMKMLSNEAESRERDSLKYYRYLNRMDLMFNNQYKTIVPTLLEKGNYNSDYIGNAQETSYQYGPRNWIQSHNPRQFTASPHRSIQFIMKNINTCATAYNSCVLNVGDGSCQFIPTQYTKD